MTAVRNRPALIQLAHLVAHPSNIRDGLGDDQELHDLARSIREHGILQPLVVTEHPTQPDRYLILAGHRRAAAARLAGHQQAPCTIRFGAEDDPGAHVVLMLVENCQRKNLNPVEKAQGLGALRNRGKNTQEIARLVGMHPSHVHWYLTLLDLDDESLEQVRTGEIAASHAVEAVITQRKAARAKAGKPVRGRPATVEPDYLTKKHPLAGEAELLCDHRQRRKIGGVACGQCWEHVIRIDDSRRRARGGR